jgi:hypothetical protein
MIQFVQLVSALRLPKLQLRATVLQRLPDNASPRLLILKPFDNRTAGQFVRVLLVLTTGQDRLSTGIELCATNLSGHQARL